MVKRRTGPPQPGVRTVHHAGGEQPREPRREEDRRAVERQVAALAGRQGGVVGREQLLALGIGPRRIDHWVATGRLIVVHRGVYAVGHAALGPRGRACAALLAAGPGAVLSHRSAAAHWQLRPEPPVPEVTVAGRRLHGRRDLVVHGVAAFHAGDVRERAGLAVTNPARTLLDLPVVEPAAALERGSRAAFERDRARDARHALAGWTVVRFTARRLRDRPLQVAAELGALLSRARPPGRRSAA